MPKIIIKFDHTFNLFPHTTLDIAYVITFNASTSMDACIVLVYCELYNMCEIP